MTQETAAQNIKNQLKSSFENEKMEKFKKKPVHGQSLYYPTNAHNVKNVELLKHIKIMEAAPTCFGLQRNHHQGATASA